MRPFEKWTEQEVVDALKLREDGFTFREIGNCMNRTKSSVAGMFNRIDNPGRFAANTDRQLRITKRFCAAVASRAAVHADGDARLLARMILERIEAHPDMIDDILMGAGST